LSAWNSLEIAKLVVSILTPLSVALLGIVVARNGKRADESAAKAARELESAQWANRRAVERLIELHKEMAPLLNDLMCFFRLIGHFREITPPEAIARKRTLDRIFFANEYLFDMQFRRSYRAFMMKCFAEWQTAGHDAKMLASASRMRNERGPSTRWEEDWDRLFKYDALDSREVRHAQQAAYNDAMSSFAAQLGLSPDSRHTVGTGAPAS